MMGGVYIGALFYCVVLYFNIRMDLVFLFGVQGAG